MNPWKNYIWMAAAIFALGVIGAFTAKPLLAQIRAALVQNVDEPGRTPYLSFVDFAGCGGTVCIPPFAPVPSGKRLVATNITGLVFLPTAGFISFAALTFQSNQGRYYVPTILQAGTVNGDNHIGINAPIGLFIDGPDQPSLFLVSTTGFSTFNAKVALSGYLVDCSSPGSCAAKIQ